MSVRRKRKVAGEIQRKATQNFSVFTTSSYREFRSTEPTSYYTALLVLCIYNVRQDRVFVLPFFCLG